MPLLGPERRVAFIRLVLNMRNKPYGSEELCAEGRLRSFEYCVVTRSFAVDLIRFLHGIGLKENERAEFYFVSDVCLRFRNPEFEGREHSSF